MLIKQITNQSYKKNYGERQGKRKGIILMKYALQAIIKIFHYPPRFT